MASEKFRLRRGQIVEVAFLDHCEGGGKPVEFVVFGRLLSIDETSLTIAAWTYRSPRRKQHARDANLTTFTILRSTIRTLYRLEKDAE